MQKEKNASKKSQEPIGEKRITCSALAKHSNEQNGYWVSIDHKVLDLSHYVAKHVGGEASLLEYVGSDISKEFSRIHENSLAANKLVNKFYIGQLYEPKFHNQKMASFWLAQKELLQCIIEEFNVYNLEISIQHKEYFPNQDGKSHTPYKRFLQDHLRTRLKTAYLNKVEKHAIKMKAWMDEYHPSWKKECPFGKITKRVQSLTKVLCNQRALPKDYTQEFLALKNKAINLCKLLEDITEDRKEFPSQIYSKASDVLQSIKNLGKN